MAALSPLERIKIAGQLSRALKELGEVPAGAASIVKRLRLSATVRNLLASLIGTAPAAVAPVVPAIAEATGPDPEPEELDEEKDDTSESYIYRDDVSAKQRQRDNDAAVNLIRSIDAGEIMEGDLSEADRAALALYSGTGGGLKRHNGKKGSQYEYYTPKPIAEAVWSLVKELGFSGGKVLDPSSGTGIFGATSPANAAIDAVELDYMSGRVNQIVNGGPASRCTISNFESFATKTPDDVYDAVVTNVPFGSEADRGSNRYDDKRYQKLDLGSYFILRSLDKLKPGGIAAFIVNTSFVSGKNGDERIRTMASLKAEFVGAFRLPNSVFYSAGADVSSDVVVFRKFSAEAAERIDELRQQNPDVLPAANVLWPDFIDGKYFITEGRRNIIGTVVTEESTRWKDANGRARLVEKVVNDGSIADIAALIRKLPGSRIDWAALNAAETSPIVYAEGDRLSLGGESLEYRNGRWIPVAGSKQDAAARAAIGERMATALDAFDAGVPWSEASAWVKATLEAGSGTEVPEWLRNAYISLQRATEAQREGYFAALVTGFACVEVKRMHFDGTKREPTDLSAMFPRLHDALAQNSGMTRTSPSDFTKEAKGALEAARTIYSRKAGYVGWWLGQGASQVAPSVSMEATTPIQHYEALRYGTESAGSDGFVSIERMRAAIGADFDPFTSDEWCVSPDGQSVMYADDYYLGNLSDFYARADADIANAIDEATRDKLIRQKAAVEARVRRIDVSRLSFTMQSPLVSLEDKLRFAREQIDPAFAISYERADGKPRIIADLNSAGMSRRNEAELALYVAAKAKELLWAWIESGQFRLGGMPEDVSDKTKDAIMAELRRIAKIADVQFNSWVAASPEIIGKVSARANDPKNIWIREVDNTAALNIPGLKSGIDPLTGRPYPLPHSYQLAAIRRYSRNFGGILGFDVGLGKTFTALWSVQHVQNIGAKKKTFFVVPNSVLPNWYKEASSTYADLSDCLFVGLSITTEADGKKTVERKAGELVKRHMNEILENKHRKVFMTFDDFGAIPLRDATVEGYRAYLISTDASLAEATSEKDQQVVDGILTGLVKSMKKKQREALPYFEDMGVDSVVMDEAHAAKNSKQTVSFRPAKMLSTAGASDRGVDAQCKSWYLRGQSAGGDGWLSLTATPVTNSPLEIYSMLSLSIGEEKLQRMMLGVSGVDNFMNLFSVIEQRDEPNLIGRETTVRYFDGLRNVSVLRTAMGAVANIKTAETVGATDIFVPEAVEKEIELELPQATKDRLQFYQLAYAGARASDSNPATSEELAALARLMEETGEPPELIGHPFSLIKKMQAAIMDGDMDDCVTRYLVADANKAAAAIQRFNDAKIIEERERLGRIATNDDIVSTKTIKDEAGGDDKILYRVHVKAFYDSGRGCVTIDTLQFGAQTRFIDIAEKAGIDLGVTIPPKLASLIENVQLENDAPRWTTRAKQIIFNDSLAMHQKIKLAIAARCGVPKNRIAIINAQAVSDASEVQDISDGFNADDDNRVQIVIANKKAEVGLNLQKGCQAIHHMTTGWTPDSLHQRNGRGVRQGNKLAYVNIYAYDAAGTFDKYKRRLVSKKADWIGQVMDDQGADIITVAGGLSNKDYDLLIKTAGNEGAMNEFERQREAADRQRAIANARESQVINYRTIVAQQKILARTPFDALKEAAEGASALKTAQQKAQARLSNAKTDTAAVKATGLLDEARARYAAAFGNVMDALPEGKRKRFSDAMAEDPRARAKTLERIFDRYSFTDADRAAINLDAEIMQGLASQHDRAKRLIDQSARDFKTVAERGGGAYGVNMVDAAMQGAAVLIGERLIADGTILKFDGKQIAVVKGGEPRGKVSIGEDGSVMAVGSLSDLLRKPGTIVVEVGDEGYDAILNDMAAADDEAVRLGNGVEDGFGMGRFWCSVLPEVADRMRNEIPTLYSSGSYALPSPLYPAPLPDDGGACGPVYAHFRSAQVAAGVTIAKTSGSRAVMRLPAGMSAERRPAGEMYGPYKMGARMAYDMALSLGAKLTPRAIAGLSFRFDHLIDAVGQSLFGIGDDAKLVPAADFDSDEKMKAWAAEQIARYMPGVEGFGYADLPRSLAWPLESMVVTAQRAVAKAAADAKQAAALAEAAASGVAIAAGPGIRTVIIEGHPVVLDDAKFQEGKGGRRAYLGPDGKPWQVPRDAAAQAGLKTGSAEWDIKAGVAAAQGSPASWVGKKATYIYKETGK